MKMGQKAIITAPPEYAYGDRSVGKFIKPGSTLMFEVEILGFKTPERKEWEAEEAKKKEEEEAAKAEETKELEEAKEAIPDPTKDIKEFFDDEGFAPQPGRPVFEGPKFEEMSFGTRSSRYGKPTARGPSRSMPKSSGPSRSMHKNDGPKRGMPTPSR